MKKLVQSISFFLILSGVLTLTGCVPSGESEENTTPLIGKWKWIQSSGGFAGETVTPESTGESRSIEFGEMGIVTFYTNGEVTLSSTFRTDAEKTIFAEDPQPVLYVEGYFMYAYSFPYFDQLELSENVYDGYSHVYIKL